MVGTAQPFLYSAVHNNGNGSSTTFGSGFPEKSFDPKAVTRASWEPKPQKPKPDGPLVSFNRHPDSHMVLQHRSNQYLAMGPRTKSYIKWIRRLQLLLRLLELNAALGLMVLLICITKIDIVTGWVLRIAPGIFALHCLYGVYHLSRSAAGRTPASSAAYQVFASLSDLVILGVYGFGAYTTHQQGSEWSTRLVDKHITKTLVLIIYYGFIGAGGAHFLSLIISFWLSIMFRKITMMPPDMNPLEDHLTARPRHKKSRSSISTMQDSARLSQNLENHRRSGRPYENISRPPSVPFMHTRTQSRNSQMNFPDRHYQIMPSTSARNSTVSLQSKRFSGYTQPQSKRGSYAEIPVKELVASPQVPESPGAQQRAAKFTETWIPTDSLISRTNNRNRQNDLTDPAWPSSKKSYMAVSEPYSNDDVSDEDDDEENVHNYPDENDDSGSNAHPNPLGANPTSPKRQDPRAQTPYRPLETSLAEISNNERRVSTSRDIADEKLSNSSDPAPQPASKHSNSSGPRFHEPLANFYSRPYGDLKCATPPVIIGANRKVSTGTDFGNEKMDFVSKMHERRNVSGKIAEEGRASYVEEVRKPVPKSKYRLLA